MMKFQHNNYKSHLQIRNSRKNDLCERSKSVAGGGCFDGERLGSAHRSTKAATDVAENISSNHKA